MRLVLDNLQGRAAKKELKAAEEVLPALPANVSNGFYVRRRNNPAGNPTLEAFP